MSSHIERAYDRSPYPEFTFGHTHPDILGATGRLFGLATADPEACSVLEIGCAVGGNLIPMAIGAPRARLVGVDISGVHIEQARATAATLRADNVTFVKGDFRELPSDHGRFDYIICHGVFAWVEPETQAALLAFIGERLAPNGVAFVSYNAYPGQHMVDMVRKLLRVHTAGTPDTTTRDAQGQEVMRLLLRRARAAKGDWREGFLAAELAHLESAAPSLVEHDYFATESHPVYFLDFVALAGRAGLSYLADSSPWLMFLGNQDPEVIETFEPLGDLVLQGQYLDFVYHTRYRATLLCRGGDALSRDLDGARLHGMHLSELLAAEPALDGLAARAPAEIELARGGVMSTSNPIVRLALRRLWQHGLAGCSFEQLTREVEQDLAAHGLTEPRGSALANRLGGLLLRAYFACAVRLSLRAPPIATYLPPRPTTGRFQRHQAAARLPRVANLDNAMFDMLPELHELLSVMDGTRTIEELQAFTSEPILVALERLWRHGYVLDPDAVARFG